MCVRLLVLTAWIPGIVPLPAATGDEPIRAVEVNLYRAKIDVVPGTAAEPSLEARLLDFDTYLETGEEVLHAADLALQVSRSGGVITVAESPTRELVALRIRARADVELRLRVVHFGDLRIEDRTADVEARIFRGSVTLTRQRGAASVIIERDGMIGAQIFDPPPGRSSAFSVFDGNIDLWLPADTTAGVMPRSFTGSVESVFPDGWALPRSSRSVLATTVHGPVRIRAFQEDE